MANNTHSFFYNWRNRSYIVHTPPNYSKYKKYNVMFNLHGGGSSASGQQTISNMDTVADFLDKWIVVYPNGTGPSLFSKTGLTWNAGTCCSDALKNNVDDIGFLKEVKNRVAKTYSTTNKFYICGYSNGAMLAYYQHLEGHFNGIASVAGSLPIPILHTSALSPVPVIHIHGTADQHIPYNGGVGSDAVVHVPHVSVDDSIAFWIKNNSANSAPSFTSGSEFECYTYEGNYPVTLVKIIDGGHTWPGGKLISPSLGKLATTVSASGLILSYFNE